MQSECWLSELWSKGGVMGDSYHKVSHYVAGRDQRASQTMGLCAIDRLGVHFLHTVYLFWCTELLISRTLEAEDNCCCFLSSAFEKQEYKFIVYDLGTYRSIIYFWDSSPPLLTFNSLHSRGWLWTIDFPTFTSQAPCKRIVGLCHHTQFLILNFVRTFINNQCWQKGRSLRFRASISGILSISRAQHFTA